MSTRLPPRLGKLSLAVAAAIAVAASAAGGFFLFKARKVEADLADFIVAHPEFAGIAAYTIDENGAAVADGFAVELGAGERLVLASTVKVAVLAAYANAVAGGQLAPNQAVPVVEWERFYLPTTDGGAHRSRNSKCRLSVDVILSGFTAQCALRRASSEESPAWD